MKVYYCAYCGDQSDRGFIQVCRACTEWMKRERKAEREASDET